MACGKPIWGYQRSPLLTSSIEIVPSGFSNVTWSYPVSMLAFSSAGRLLLDTCFSLVTTLLLSNPPDTEKDCDSLARQTPRLFPLIPPVDKPAGPRNPAVKNPAKTPEIDSCVI